MNSILMTRNDKPVKVRAQLIIEVLPDGVIAQFTENDHTNGLAIENITQKELREFYKKFKDMLIYKPIESKKETKKLIL